MIERSDFWMSRLLEVLAKAESAPSKRSRDAYLDLALHYRSMHEFVQGGRLGQNRATELRSPVRSDLSEFRSVHDLLAA